MTCTIIAVIGNNLMRLGSNWIFGNPFGPTAPSVVNPAPAKWLADAAAATAAPGCAFPAILKGISPTSIAALALNLVFNEASAHARDALNAAEHADAP